MKIAWIGTGDMGSPIVEKLLKENHSLVVYNRTESKAKKLVNKGAAFAVTPKDAVSNADLVFCTVTDDIASKAVWEGKDGIVSGLQDKSIVIESSTLSISRCNAIKELVINHTAAKFLTMPLVGTPNEAASGELLLLVGGDSEVLEHVRSILSSIGKDIILVGNELQAMAFKLALTGSVALQMLLQDELLCFLRAHDVKPEMINVFENLPFTSAITGITNTIKAGGAFDKLFPIKLVHKDMRYLADSIANDDGSSLLTTVKDIYASVNVNGEGFQR